MLKYKFSKYIVAVLFACILIVPIFATNFSSNDYSAMEKRHLSSFPEFFTEDGKFNSVIWDEFSDWLVDHIGFRSELVQLTSRIKLHLFHQSPSDQVHIGKEG